VTGDGVAACGVVVEWLGPLDLFWSFFLEKKKKKKKNLVTVPCCTLR
jgi:hypothetical protein